MGAPFRTMLGLATMSALAGFLACREATQITLTVTTDAGCPTDEATTPRLNDVIIFSGRKVALGGGDLVPNASTEQCSAADPNLIGTLVFLPDGGDDPAVEVLVVAGVQRDANDDSDSRSAGACMAIVNDPDPSKRSIEGLPCIVSRRRLTFVPHNSLVLPINLDRRCIGQECGADLTCFEGNCVDPSISCSDGQGCTEPKGCTETCDKTCASANGTCVEGECQCGDCDPNLCNGTCADQNTCACAVQGECTPDACDMGCSGQCDMETQVHGCVTEGCVCQCDPMKCKDHCEGIKLPIWSCDDSTQKCDCQDMPGTGGGGNGAGGNSGGNGGNGAGGNSGGNGGNGTGGNSGGGTLGMGGIGGSTGACIDPPTLDCNTTTCTQQCVQLNVNPPCHFSGQCGPPPADPNPNPGTGGGVMPAGVCYCIP